MLKTDEIYHQSHIQKGRCPECNESKFVTDRDSGELVCFQCGLVLKDVMLDQNAEWRAYTQAEVRAKARAGPPISYSYYDKGLSTTFQTNREYNGKRLSPKTQLKMTRLRKWDYRTKVHASIDRNLSQAMTELEILADKLHIPKSVKDEAALTYRKALDAGLVRGRSIASIVAAAIYAACRFTETPRKITEIVKASSKNRKEITRCYRLIVKKLDLKMPIINPQIYISKIASKVGLDQKIEFKAMEIIRKAKKIKATSGKGPAGIAAAALYIASLDNTKKITQKHLADAAEVTEVTVRNRYKELIKDLELKLK